jgi:hypothetical protein
MKNPESAYVAGKMRGMPLYNFQAFAEAAMVLRDQGIFVRSPAERDLAHGFDPSLALDDLDQRFDLEEAFAWDFWAITNTECIVLLPGWETSEGTKKEIILAQGLGKRIFAYNCGLLEPIEPKITVTAA